MLKGILTILLFIFIVLVVVVLMVTNVIVRTFRRMKQHIENQRDEQSDAYFRRYSQKPGTYSEDEKVVFDKNYFDSVDNYGWEKKTQKEQPKSTTTKEGTVIIDHRTPKKNNKKIYDDGDGEYVEFSEVTD